MNVFTFVVHALACLLLSSCTVAKKGDETLIAFGGKGAYKGGFGVIWNNEKSFRDGALATSAIATSGFSAATDKAGEVTQQVINTNAAKTSQKATESAAAVEIVKDNNATKVLLAPPE